VIEPSKYYGTEQAIATICKPNVTASTKQSD